jgi:Cu(I)/Ag(I) efflux system membrane fusion protein
MKYLLVILGILFFIGCKTKNKEVAAANPDVYYTCSMHPQVVAQKPGKCPICHMDLIAVTKGSKSLPNEIELSEEQIQLGNIHADTIGKSIFGNQMVVPGTINFNENNINTVSSRVMGRIDRLYYKNIGDFVRKGAKLYEIYSEELNSAKQEYILLLQKRKELGNAVVDYEQLLRSARTKLLLWRMTEGQLNALEQTGKSSITTTFYSTAGGYITALDVTEGDYTMQGGLIIHLASMGNVWAEAQVYTTQLSQMVRNAPVKVQIPELGKEVAGRVEFVNPEINTQTRFNLVRVNVPNPGNQLKPGMAVYIVMANNQKPSLSLPADAVIRSANMAHVWIMTTKNKFKFQQVQTGAESGNNIEIVQGIKQGDAVVITGAYLLNSEFILRNGGNGMEGMKM